jgi:SAM-dependent methyltransferase
MESRPGDAARRERLEQWAWKHRSRAEAEQYVRDQQRLRKRLAKAPTAARYGVVRGSSWLADRLFDRGLDTAASTNEPEHEHPDRLLYVASAWNVLPRALRFLGVSESDVFVDFGCGKGRVVHQAAQRPFRRVIGVEISPALAEIARANLAARRHQHRCRQVEIVVSDAMQFPIPDDLTIGYLFHSFRGEVLDAVLRGIVESIDRQPRRVRLIYVHPIHSEQVLETGRFRLLKEQRPRFLLDSVSRTKIFESI